MTHPMTNIKKFRITAGDFQLGEFDTCTGLGCRIEVEETFNEGTTPLNVRFEMLQVTRMPSLQMFGVWSWFKYLTVNRVRLSATVTALDTDGFDVIRWELKNAAPYRWTGLRITSLENPTCAPEELDIVHYGIMSMESARS